MLPGLLERSLARGWRAVVQTASDERAEALDAHLWTYADDSFLPHGLAVGDSADRQPILLTTGEDNQNRANVRFLVDGVGPGEVAGYERVVIMFDGNDDEAVSAARGWWKRVKGDGHEATYWQQNPAGRWEEKA